jgi:hypothetical protein
MKTVNQKEIVADKNLIAFCGLYCGACRSYLSGKCPGCTENVKATWCGVRQCCLENQFQSCADCRSVELMSCKKYNNFISKAFGFIFNSDRSACIARIKETGYDEFAIEMAESRRQTIKRKA